MFSSHFPLHNGHAMHARWILPFIVWSLVLVYAPLASRGGEVVQHVPNDALGFLVINKLGAMDAKVAQVLTKLEAPLPGPLAFLRAATGISEGLDPNGDFLLVVMPGERAVGNAPKFAVWLPVGKYDRLVASLEAAPGQRITAVTIAGEDVLIARHGTWALVMDPDQRQRLEQMLEAEPNPPAALASWQEWIDGNDLSVVMLRGGIRAALTWATQTPATFGPQPEPVEESDDDPFDFGQAGTHHDPFVAAPPAPNDVVSSVQSAVRKWIAASPKASEWVLRSDAVGCALRLDGGGNAIASLRVSLANSQATEVKAGDSQIQPPPVSLYQDGKFVLHGAGSVPTELAVLAAGMFARFLVDDLKTEESMVLRDATVARFQGAVEKAAAGVAWAAVLTQPGDDQPGVYTNDFLLVRTTEAATFAAHVADVMGVWNTMNREATGGTPLVFETEETKFGQREATQFSLDVAAADGAPPLPEIRQAMEKFFGPGGKLRLWVVPVDDEMVLLARGLPEQVSAALEVLDRKQPIDWRQANLQEANQLLPPESGWRLFFSPHGYNAWLKRQREALVGGPVIGGPLVKEFAPSPPVGFAGAMRGGELWIDAAVPVETIQAAARHLHRGKRVPIKR